VLLYCCANYETRMCIVVVQTSARYRGGENDLVGLWVAQTTRVPEVNGKGSTFTSVTIGCLGATHEAHGWRYLSRLTGQVE